MSIGLLVRVRSADRPREWRAGRLDLVSLGVEIGDEVIPRGRVVAIMCAPDHREDAEVVRDIPVVSQPMPVDPAVACAYGLLLLEVAGASRKVVEQFKDAAWPEVAGADARAARELKRAGDGDGRPLVR